MALVNTRKAIDLDYYFALDYKQKAENNEEEEEYTSYEEDEEPNESEDKSL